MEFEQELRIRLRSAEEKEANTFMCAFRDDDYIQNITKEILQNFLEIVEIFYFKKYENEKQDKEILKKIYDVENLFIEKNLAQMYSQITLSEEEKSYIQYVKLSQTWRGKEFYSHCEAYAIREILIRRIIMQHFTKEEISEIMDIMQEEKKEGTPRRKNTCYYFLELLSDKPYGTKMQEKVEEIIEERTEKSFNYRINCGGYALKVDQYISPISHSAEFGKIVSTILERYPFVRLLGDTKLMDDEYMVIYRAEKDAGHHFIRVDEDGIVREKDAVSPPCIFSEWMDNLKTAPEAVFAVKKKHKMFDYTFEEITEKKMGLDFEETTNQAIKEKRNNFTYHGQQFSLKKTSSDEVVIVSNGFIVAEVLIDGEERIVDIIEDKKEYVENFSGRIKPIIKDGHLLNMREFVDRKRMDEVGRG